MLRKLVALTVLTLAMLFISIPPERVEAANAVMHYTVYSGCFGPIAGIVSGEWTRDCDGEWYGWGDRPGEYSCNSHVTTIGESCDQ
jgi:hypothetical protein